LLMLSRFKQRFDGKEFDPSSEFNLSSLVNNTLERILEGERSISGWPFVSCGGFPAFGSSSGLASF
jgi:hypothetical protein